ncbi:thioredoxin domain-containing protein [Geobacter sp. SVR]|uniref:thioredoxin domain-containing protein n=1 Tax=Geobacter sp. SVR TaxID=2495594 RepID=UPI00143F015F|nr:thioredoxin domain-containing protein [Geobacter sp. SVR]BCS54288.1 thioredoxin [Geobacter sp. SVR]GCF85853.1 thioredoxin [Geobacter sp. SVR]
MMKTQDSGAYIANLMRIDKTTLPADGGERFNRLIFARSPYLLQHAENPVDWYEWGQEAFDKARTENLPILLSIGYATCHWCHVMAHESFEDAEVAALLNGRYVCIKVDREERPDVDDFYMTVSQVLTGSGGWPLNIFLTPDRRPFFAMTYLPKLGRSGTGGLMELLANISILWEQQPDRIEKNCRGIMEALGQLSQQPAQETIEITETVELAFEQLSRSYDRDYGGFGTAPKFPMAVNLDWLIAQGTEGNKEALKMALHTLRSIRQGGIWDQLDGGLHRYSVDQEWLVPHFEKMLYDQAQIAMSAISAYQASRDPFFREMADTIFGFVAREMTSPEGGFYSALDADSEGMEGKFYLWDKSDVDRILGADADLFCSYFDITAEGNFEGRSIPNIPVPLEEFCRQEDRSMAATERALERCRTTLLEQREGRIRPLRDEKIITAWNGLMIAALARGGVVLDTPAYTERAARAADFIQQRLQRPDGRLLRSYLNGPADIPAFLEDYAFLCHGLIELFEATLDNAWLDRALGLADQMARLFYDPSAQTFSKTGHDAEQMPVRASLEHDGVMPSAYSLAAGCLVRLGHAAERPDLHDLAHVLLAGTLSEAGRQPAVHLGTLAAYLRLESEPVIVRLQGRRDSPQVRELLRTTKSSSVPHLVIQFSEDDHQGRASVCAHGACHAPTSDCGTLERLLAS